MIISKRIIYMKNQPVSLVEAFRRFISLILAVVMIFNLTGQAAAQAVSTSKAKLPISADDLEKLLKERAYTAQNPSGFYTPSRQENIKRFFQELAQKDPVLKQLEEIRTFFNPLFSSATQTTKQSSFETFKEQDAQAIEKEAAAVRASRQRNGTYKYPIYGLPEDLLEINLRDFDPSLPPRRLIGRIEENRIVPYYTREYIENNPLRAPVLLWGDNAVDILIMQIQGSAVAELDDGSKIRIAYAGSNGHPFKGIGSILLEKRLIKPGQASMGEIRKWLNLNFDKAYPHLLENKRFIFHRLSDAPGPVGAQGVALEAGRSLAVDRSFIPLGALLWLQTSGPDKKPLHRLVVAQDIGSAIKGAVRGDYFWGSGSEGLEFAGRMNAKGHYYILLPKNQGEIK